LEVKKALQFGTRGTTPLVGLTPNSSGELLIHICPQVLNPVSEWKLQVIKDLCTGVKVSLLSTI